jgi:hypothetical protein
MPDDVVARRIVQLLDYNDTNLFGSPQSSRLCSVCRELDIYVSYSDFERSMKNLRRDSQSGCKLCEMLLEVALATNISLEEPVHFHISREGIRLDGEKSNALRLVRNLGTC